MLSRFQKSRAVIFALTIAVITVCLFQNCKRMQTSESSSLFSSLNSPSATLDANSLVYSQSSSGLINYCSADKSALLDSVNISINGASETVWQSPNPNSITGPIPDGTTTAYRDAQGKVSMLIVHSDTFRITGNSLNNLNPNSTEVVFRSAQKTTETDYNHRHWLMAPYSIDGNNFVGVNHHEWYACKVKNDCNDDYQVILRSWANSLTKTVSSDGGRTWSVPANHLIIAPPLWNNKPYNTPDVNNHGFFHPTKIVREGNYYYLFSFASTSRDLPAASSYQGMIILRTTDFNRWQFWTGGSRYADITSSEKPAVIPDMNTVLVSLTYNASLCSYMAVFATGDSGRGPSALYFKLTASLANPQWTAAKEITGSRHVSIANNINNSGFIVNNYPSLLDPLSDGYNFEITGENPYVYFNNVGPDAFVRNVYRLPLKIDRSGGTQNPNPTPPSQPPPTNPPPTPGPTPGPTSPPITTPAPQTKIPAGYFSVGAGIYYSNGSSYCYFPSMAEFTQASGKSSKDGILSVTSLPSGMKNDGACRPANPSSGGGSPPPAVTGLFMVGSGIYYSNGSAYCYFPSMDLFIARTGKQNADGIVRLTQTPSGLRNDGACQ